MPSRNRKSEGGNRVLQEFSQRMLYLREESRSMFYHGFNSYMKHAYPWDELKPLSCSGRRWNQRERGTLDDSLGGFSTTLVDSLDMFALIGDYAGFRKYVRMVIDDVHFSRNVNVSVFETNIRVLGGMLSQSLNDAKARFVQWPQVLASARPFSIQLLGHEHRIYTKTYMFKCVSKCLSEHNTP